MAKRVLRYNEEEFITLLENIVKKVKSEEQRIQESRDKRKSINENRTSRPNPERRPSSKQNDRFKKLR